MNKKQIMYVLIFLAVLFLGWIAFGYFSIRGIERLEFSVIEEKDGYEIRQYESYIVASAVVSGNYNQGINRGFRVVADYIFGNNTKREAVEMTTPVIEEGMNEKVAMTTPVIEEQMSEAVEMTTPVVEEEMTKGMREVSFVMPSKYSLETLPIPNNENVTIKEIPSQKMAVIKFRGYGTNKKMEEKKAELLSFLERDGLNYGRIQTAQYNPPLTPPFMRENEIWVVLEGE